MANTLANNHLSKLAQKGRMGDDKILQFSDGRIEHGNAFEEKLMGDAVGESLVDAIGSKTINPETGLKENWYIQAAGLVLAGLQSAATGKSASDAAKSQAEHLKLALEQNKETKEMLASQSRDQKEFTNLQFQKQFTDFSREAGVETEKLTKEYTQAAGKTGLAFSGEVAEEMDKSLDLQQERVGSAQEGLMAEHGKAIGEITGNFESTMAQLNAEEQRMKKDLQMAEKQADAWFLGKNFLSLGDDDKWFS